MVVSDRLILAYQLVSRSRNSIPKYPHGSHVDDASHLKSINQQPPTPIRPLSTWVIVASIAGWLSLCFAAASIVIERDIRNVNDELTQYGEAYADHLNKELVGNESVLKGFSALFAAVGNTSPKQVSRYVGQVIESNPQIFSLEIVQKVPGGQLAEYITRRRRNGLPGFTVKSFSYDSDRKWQPVGDKPFYYPIVFIAPLHRDSEDILGLDVDSVSFLRKALRASLHRSRPVSSHPFRLVEGNLAYVVFCPITRPMRSHDSPQLHDNQDGFMVDMVVDAAKLTQPVKLPLFDGGTVLVYHKDFQPDDPEGQLLAMSGKARSPLETSLFPNIIFQKSLGTLGEPFSLMVRRQVGWCDLNLTLLALIALGSALSSLFLIAYLRKYRQGQHLHAMHQQLLWQHANHDALTGLPNRMLLMDRMEQVLARMLRQNKRFAVMFLDLDDFKQVNDTYGHAAGDHLLKLVAERLSAAVRTEDTVARLSGDEFIILIESIESLETLETVQQKIQQTLTEGFVLDSQVLHVHVSFGVVMFPEDGNTPESLLNQADMRMYADKQARKEKMPWGEGS